MFYSNKSYDQSLDILKTAKLLAEELQILDFEYGNILLYIGKIKIKQNDKQEALYYLNLARKLLESIKKEDGFEPILAILEIYLAEGNTIKS